MFKNVQKKLVLKKTHSSISHLQMGRCNTLDYSFEDVLYDWLEFSIVRRDLNNFEHFRKKQSLFCEVGKRPVFKNSLQ